MCEVFFWMLEPQPLPPHPTSTYIYGATIATKVRGGRYLKGENILLVLIFWTNSRFGP